MSGIASFEQTPGQCIRCGAKWEVGARYRKRCDPCAHVVTKEKKAKWNKKRQGAK